MKFHTVDVQGKIWTQRVDDKDTTRHHTAVDEARLIYSRADSRLYFGSYDDWHIVMGKYDFITADTRMLFGYWPLPDGWNINTSKNDMVIQVTQSGDVGQIDGSWTITGMDQAGLHDHGGETGQADNDIRRGVSDYEDPRAASENHRHTIATDGLHGHGFAVNWRPSYINFVEARFE